MPEELRVISPVRGARMSSRCAYCIRLSHNDNVLGSCLALSFVLLCRQHDRMNTSPGRPNLVARGPSPRRSHAITTAALRRLVKSGATLCTCMRKSARRILPEQSLKSDFSVANEWGTRGSHGDKTPPLQQWHGQFRDPDPVQYLNPAARLVCVASSSSSRSF